MTRTGILLVGLVLVLAVPAATAKLPQCSLVQGEIPDLGTCEEDEADGPCNGQVDKSCSERVCRTEPTYDSEGRPTGTREVCTEQTCTVYTSSLGCIVG